MTHNDMTKIKQYLKHYFGITIKRWTPNTFASTNWKFFKKHNVTLEEMLKNYQLADQIENELQQPIPEIEQNGSKLSHQSKYNKNLYLIIDEFST